MLFRLGRCRSPWAASLREPHWTPLIVAAIRTIREIRQTAGFETDSTKQLGSILRTFPLRLTGLRADGYNNLDISVLKDFPIRERVAFQVRAEATDALNHAMFSSPNTTPTSTLFGQVTSTIGQAARVIVITGSLTW